MGLQRGCESSREEEWLLVAGRCLDQWPEGEEEEEGGEVPPHVGPTAHTSSSSSASSSSTSSPVTPATTDEHRRLHRSTSPSWSPCRPPEPPAGAPAGDPHSQTQKAPSATPAGTTASNSTTVVGRKAPTELNPTEGLHCSSRRRRRHQNPKTPAGTSPLHSLSLSVSEDAGGNPNSPGNSGPSTKPRGALK